MACHLADRAGTISPISTRQLAIASSVSPSLPWLMSDCSPLFAERTFARITPDMPGKAINHRMTRVLRDSAAVRPRGSPSVSEASGPSYRPRGRGPASLLVATSHWPSVCHGCCQRQALHQLLMSCAQEMQHLLGVRHFPIANWSDCYRVSKSLSRSEPESLPLRALWVSFENPDFSGE